MSVLRRADLKRVLPLIDYDYDWAKLLTALALGSLSKDCLWTEGMLASDPATSFGVDSAMLKRVMVWLGKPADSFVLLAVVMFRLEVRADFAASRFTSYVDACF